MRAAILADVNVGARNAKQRTAHLYDEEGNFQIFKIEL